MVEAAAIQPDPVAGTPRGMKTGPERHRPGPEINTNRLAVLLGKLTPEAGQRPT